MSDSPKCDRTTQTPDISENEDEDCRETLLTVPINLHRRHPGFQVQLVPKYVTEELTKDIWDSEATTPVTSATPTDDTNSEIQDGKLDLTSDTAKTVTKMELLIEDAMLEAEGSTVIPGEEADDGKRNATQSSLENGDISERGHESNGHTDDTARKVESEANGASTETTSVLNQEGYGGDESERNASPSGTKSPSQSSEGSRQDRNIPVQPLSFPKPEPGRPQLISVPEDEILHHRHCKTPVSICVDPRDKTLTWMAVIATHPPIDGCLLWIDADDRVLRNFEIQDCGDFDLFSVEDRVYVGFRLYGLIYSLPGAELVFGLHRTKKEDLCFGRTMSTRRAYIIYRNDRQVLTLARIVRMEPNAPVETMFDILQDRVLVFSVSETDGVIASVSEQSLLLYNFSGLLLAMYHFNWGIPLFPMDVCMCWSIRPLPFMHKLRVVVSCWGGGLCFYRIDGDVVESQLPLPTNDAYCLARIGRTDFRFHGKIW